MTTNPHRDDVAAMLADATVVHLQPDDMIVLRMAADMIITPDLAERVRDAFAPRRVVVLAAGIDIGHADGATHWTLTTTPHDGNGAGHDTEGRQ